MSEQSWSQKLTETIYQTLPDDLQGAAHFIPDQTDTYLLLDFPGLKLDRDDYPKMFKIAKQFSGDFCNKNPNGQECYWRFPKSVDAKPTVVPGASPQPQTDQQPAPAGNSQPTPKQPSPKTVFSQKYCLVCADQTFCTSDQSLTCVEMLKLQALEAITEKLSTRPSYSGGSRYPPKPQPTERHSEGDIKWLYDTNQKGEKYEKALQTENASSQGYQALNKMLSDASTAGKKGLVLEGKWHWLSQRGEYVGRKAARDFKEASR